MKTKTKELLANLFADSEFSNSLSPRRTRYHRLGGDRAAGSVESKIRRSPIFVRRWVPDCSAGVALAGSYWMIERIIGAP